LALAGLFGCAVPPASVPWRDDQETIRAQRTAPEGSLVVETEVSGSTEEGVILHAPFYVYDEAGRYMTRFPDSNLFPVRLPAGRYVVVSRLSGKNKRVQVELREGLMTTVLLADFRAAPAVE
jgi:hypothetical protein